MSDLSDLAATADPFTTAPVTAEPPATPAEGDHPSLTPRESQVVAGVAAGMTNDQIGRRLGISRWTVVNYLRRVMWKWDCATRVDVAVRHATTTSTTTEHPTRMGVTS